MTGPEVVLEGVPWIDLPAPGRLRIRYGTRTRRPGARRAHQKEKEPRIDYPCERRL
jgi:hypothetical protein